MVVHTVLLICKAHKRLRKSFERMSHNDFAVVNKAKLFDVLMEVEKDGNKIEDLVDYAGEVARAHAEMNKKFGGLLWTQSLFHFAALTIYSYNAASILFGERNYMRYSFIMKSSNK